MYPSLTLGWTLLLLAVESSSSLAITQFQDVVRRRRAVSAAIGTLLAITWPPFMDARDIRRYTYIGLRSIALGLGVERNPQIAARWCNAERHQ